MFKSTAINNTPEIFLSEYIWMTFTSLGSHEVLTQGASPTIFKVMVPTYWFHELDLTSSHDVIGHVTSRSAICYFLLVSHCNRTCVSSCFLDIRPPIPDSTHTVTRTRRHGFHILSNAMYGIALDRQQVITNNVTEINSVLVFWCSRASHATLID